MKNMISALHSSYPQRAKLFERSGVKFGWEDIELLKQREDERSFSGQMRFVSGLLSSYIERDSWTKLNVKPSKIFQQDAVLSELFSHANSVNQGNCSAMQVYKYLLAVNKIFERGLLSKYPVYNMSSPIISGITEGYQYFLDWLNESNCNAEHDKKQFLAWQTWYLLTILLYGTKSLVDDFTSRNPGYFVVLSRINGSSVESLFSQLKYSVAGKLTSINYSNARASVLVKSNCHANNTGNVEYRDVELNLM